MLKKKHQLFKNSNQLAKKFIMKIITINIIKNKQLQISISK